MKHIENIIFDLDGTLIDSSDGVVTSVNYSLRMMNQPTQPPEAIKALIGYPLSRMYAQFTDIPTEELYHHFQNKAKETIVASTTVLPEVSETLQHLYDKGYHLAIASTKIRPHIEGILEKFGWAYMFSAYAGGNEVTKVKPDPEIFRLILQRLSVTSGKSIVLGDTINDILAAKAVPITVVAVASPYGGKEKVQQAKPDYFIENISELPNLLTSTILMSGEKG
ncbi:MAG: HAD-IA family hydrolase [candidate division Zixibacteria bacterium]|nr:HAD-IA family hydrolase [candidate division Zixibacteria bacterium]